MNKRLVALTLTYVLFLLGANTALADTHSGTIERLHYNSNVPGRNVCVRTVPEAPGSGWICLYEKHLTEEINDLLRIAYERNKTCGFSWSSTDPAEAPGIDWVECYNP
jgi:hypothetical protein